MASWNAQCTVHILHHHLWRSIAEEFSCRVRVVMSVFIPFHILSICATNQYMLFIEPLIFTSLSSAKVWKIGVIFMQWLNDFRASRLGSRASLYPLLYLSLFSLTPSSSTQADERPSHLPPISSSIGREMSLWMGWSVIWTCNIISL